jgi:carboxyl-terminal processing protease
MRLRWNTSVRARHVALAAAAASAWCGVAGGAPLAPQSAPPQATPTQGGATGRPAIGPRPPTAYEWFDPLIDLRALILGGFVETPDATAMQRAALEAMARALNDPYTSYVPPDSEGLLRRQIQGSYVGIGVELDLADERPVVVTALDDSPALHAGLLPGDVILEVDGRSTEGVDAIGLEQLLPGSPGTSVRLLLRRPDGTERSVTVVRAQIESRSVKGVVREGDGWRFMLDPERRIGYMRIGQFNDRTVEQVDSAIARMRGHGLSGLVLDLRGNGGGALEAAVQVADRFLRGGAILSLKGRGERGRTWDATASDEDVDVPMVVLVNQGTASASEVLAGALQDNARAKVIGTRSYGKGSVQEVRALPDGAGLLKMTTARYYLPSGRTVARAPGATRWGVEPDSGFHVAMTEAEQTASVLARRAWEGEASPTPQRWEDAEWIRREAHDPQLAAALRALQGLLAEGSWPVVGDLSGEVGASNDELRAQLELRRRLLADLARSERAISTLRGRGAGVDDAHLASRAALIDGEVVVRDRDGREVARWSIKDPEALERALRDIGAPVHPAGAAKTGAAPATIPRAEPDAPAPARVPAPAPPMDAQPRTPPAGAPIADPPQAVPPAPPPAREPEPAKVARVALPTGGTVDIRP